MGRETSGETIIVTGTTRLCGELRKGIHVYSGFRNLNNKHTNSLPFWGRYRSTVLTVVSLACSSVYGRKKYLSRSPTRARANWTFVELPSERIPAPPRAYRVINRVRAHRPFACTTLSSTRFFIPPLFSKKGRYARSSPPSNFSCFVVFT